MTDDHVRQKPTGPVLCHSELGARDCAGGVVVRRRCNGAEFVCNRCGQIFGCVPIPQVDNAVMLLGRAAEA